MKAAPDPLVRHLVIAVALKLMVLAVLWWAFVRDAGVGVDVDGVAAQVAASAGAITLPSVPSGAQP